MTLDDNTGYETMIENESIGDHVTSENQAAGYRGRGTGSDRTVSFVSLNLHSTQTMAATVSTGIKTESEVEMGTCEKINICSGGKSSERDGSRQKSQEYRRKWCVEVKCPAASCVCYGAIEDGKEMFGRNGSAIAIAQNSNWRIMDFTGLRSKSKLISSTLTFSSIRVTDFIVRNTTPLGHTIVFRT